MANEHGGKRDGAGRPEGSRNNRTALALEFLDQEEQNPVKALADVMRQAREENDPRLVAYCAKALMPYYLPKQRPAEEGEEDQHRAITVHVNFPLPGEHWRTGKPVPQHVIDYLDDTED